MINLCPPAIIYLIFSTIQILIDAINGLYNTALIKIIVATMVTLLLNILCQQGMNVVSWIIVFIPFILMSIIIRILLLMLGLDPTTGKLKVYGNEANKPVADPRKHQLQTKTSLLKHLDDELNAIDYSELDKC
jgi:hypothetical protein